MKKHYKISVEDYYKMEDLKDSNNRLELHNKILRREVQKLNQTIKDLISENKTLKEAVGESTDKQKNKNQYIGKEVLKNEII